MKIKPEHYALLESAVNRARQENPAATREAYLAAGLTEMRWRWDLLSASRLRIGDGIGQKDGVPIYAYANDDHIDTALRRITRA